MRTYLSVLFTSLILNLTPGYIAAAQADDLVSPQGMKEWTFLVYLNGHNNLDPYGATNIKQMEQVGSTKDINVVVQWASSSGGSTKRLLVKKSTNPQAVTSPIVQDMGKVDMGDWRNIVEFVKWANVTYPAKHYFLNVWDHGSGWHAIQLQMHTNDISWDDDSGNSITTQQLGMALTESAKVIGHKIDLYASDACLMAMAEVANELASSVDIYAGSEEVEPAAGWPYDAVLRRWSARPTMGAADVAKVLTEEYVKSYNGGSNGSSDVTYSAFDLSKMDQFNNSITTLGNRLMKLDAKGRKKVVDVASNALSFTNSDYVDLGDFLNLVDKTREIDSGAIASVRSAVSEFVIANADTTKYSNAKGVSIWLPSTLDTYKSYVEKYKVLQFNRGTHWSDALQYVLQDAASRQ